MVLSKREIEDYLVQNNLFDHSVHFVWATVGDSYFILAVDEVKLVLLPITSLGHISGEIHLLERENIEQLEMKKLLLGYKLRIKPVDDMTMAFVIRSFMLGYKGQAEALQAILKMLHNLRG
jgi:hypothetical protein